MTTLVLKRAYPLPAAADGTHMLVDRLWRRGISTSTARIDLWLKDIASSDALRKHFHRKPED